MPRPPAPPSSPAATKKARPIATVAPEVPPAVAAVIDKALAFDKKRRFDDADAMREALQRAFTDGVAPESAPRPSQSPRSTRPPSDPSVPISVDDVPVSVRYDSSAEGDSILVTFEDETGQSERGSSCAGARAIPANRPASSTTRS